MRSIWKSLVFATAGLAAAPLAALADDVEAQLKQMQDRMNQLEDRLQATTDQLEATEKKANDQQALIERAGIADGKAGASGLSAFIDSITVGGHVATSYNYNFNKPDVPLQGANGLRAFDPTADSFALDQIRFDIERPINTENRGGFRADIYFGRTARILNTFTGGGFGTGDDSSVHVSQGYIQYQEPFGDVQIKMGKFVTLLGAEVIDATANWNISRGLLFTNMIPAEHLGVLAGRKYENGIEWDLGVVNGWDAANGADINRSKSVTGRIGWANEMFGVQVNGIYGAEQDRIRTGSPTNINPVTGAPFGPVLISDNRDERSVLDVILSFNPTEKLKTYVNFDFGWEQFSDTSVASSFSAGPVGQPSDFLWGVSAAGRYAITDRLGISLRGEYMKSAESGLCAAETFGGTFGLCAPVNGSVTALGQASQVWGLTTTLDYALTDHLTVRTEFRYDRADVQRANTLFDATGNAVGSISNDEVFRGGYSDARLKGHANQQTVAAELIYKF